MAIQNDTLRSPSYDIYTGFWIDWSHGRVMGSTITLSKTNGSLLVAFLALFVSFVGTSVWRIVCYGLHRFYSREPAQDALYHQRQAILRNSSNGTSGVWSLLQVLWTWKSEKATQRPYQRILPVLSLGVCCIGAVGAAGTFSSRVTTAMGYHVLLANPNCTRLHADLYEENIGKTVGGYMGEQVSQWNNWAERCYTGSTFFGNCMQFTKERLQSTVIRNASCPFPGDICLTTNSSGSMVFDTGFLDSHEDFGINAPEDERITYRGRTSCAPLVTEGYEKEVIYEDGSKGMTYLYGNISTFEDYTYTYPALSEQSVLLTDYTTFTYSAYAINGTAGPIPGLSTISHFTPIPDLQVHDSDITIIFLSANGVIFMGPVDDPWYSAHVEMDVPRAGTAAPSELRYADKPASPLACAIQQQICNPNLPEDSRCTPLSGMFDLEDRARRLWTDERHLEIWNTLLTTMIGAFLMVPDVVDKLKSGALTARRFKFGAQQYPVPNDQWQRDLEQWHATALVSMQAAALTAATQSQNPDWTHILAPIESKEGKKVCRNIKIYDSAYSNFSVFGLSFTLVVGAIIITLSYTLESLVGWIQRKKNYDTYAQLEWACNETLQLQRLANEKTLLDEVTWRGCVATVPIPARANQRLGVLDVSDREHPVLKAPPPTLENLLSKSQSKNAGASCEDEAEKTVVREV